MFPVSSMHLLIQIQLHHAAQVQESPHHRSVCRCLTYSFSDNDDDTTPDDIPLHDNTSQVQHHMDTLQHPSSKPTLNAYVHLEEDEEDEDFQTICLDDGHWDMEEIPDRHLCVHENPIPHELCPYPCPYSDYQASSYYITLDLSDFSLSLKI